MSDEAAFPIIRWKSPDGMYATDMQRGMTLRDYFAGQALVGLLASPRTPGDSPPPYSGGTYATIAYACADAMLAARADSEE